MNDIPRPIEPTPPCWDQAADVAVRLGAYVAETSWDRAVRETSLSLVAAVLRILEPQTLPAGLDRRLTPRLRGLHVAVARQVGLVEAATHLQEALDDVEMSGAPDEASRHVLVQAQADTLRLLHLARWEGARGSMVPSGPGLPGIVAPLLARLVGRPGHDGENRRSQLRRIASSALGIAARAGSHGVPAGVVEAVHEMVEWLAHAIQGDTPGKAEHAALSVSLLWIRRAVHRHHAEDGFCAVQFMMAMDQDLIGSEREWEGAQRMERNDPHLSALNETAV